MFRHAIHDGQSFYVINDVGEMLWYADTKADGTRAWATNSGNRIGVGWDDAVRIFPGSDPGEIYVVKPSGDLLWYRDTARTGTNDPSGRSGWDQHSGQVIGYGWHDFIHVFPGPNGVIYAVKPTGELMWYRDLKKPLLQGIHHKSRWENDGVGKQIGVGWDMAATIVSSRGAAPPQSSNDYVIYMIKPTGEILWYHDDRADGSNDPHGLSGWGENSGQQIGQGWNEFTAILGAAGGVIYGTKRSGELLWYKDLLRDGTNSAGGSDWATNSGAQVGNGWFAYPASLPPTQQFDLDSVTFDDSTPVGGNAHLTLRSDGSLTFWGHFHNAGAIDYNISFMMIVRDANDTPYSVAVSGHLSGSTGTGSHDYDFRIDSRNDLVAQQWPAIVSYAVAEGHIKADSDLEAFISEVFATAGIVLSVIALIPAGGPPQKPPPPCCNPNGPAPPLPPDRDG